MGNCGGTSAEPPNPDWVDLTHFELLKVVGKGGFGKVNAITHLSTQELLALKRIEKHRIIKSKSHLTMVWTERRIMSIVRSPFLCHLRYAFESDTELFLVMPFLQGGDLRFHLKERGRMREETSKFYAAQIVLGLEELHRHWIVYRDLKPENVLLDDRGNLQVTDFGLAFMLRDEDKRRTRGQAGTRGYMAPETMGVRGYGLSVDYFSFGVMLYELLHGTRPWKNIDTSMAMMGLEGEIDPLAAVRNHRKDKDKELDDAARGLGKQKESGVEQQRIDPAGDADEDDEDKPDVIRFSSRLSEDAKALLLALLEFNPNKRLGCMPQQSSMERPQLGWSHVKSHAWFASIDWAAMEAGHIKPPFLPDVTHANCTPDADLADQLLDKKPKRIRDDEQKVFAGWSWNTKVNKDSGGGEADGPGRASGSGEDREPAGRKAADADGNSQVREGRVRGSRKGAEEEKVGAGEEEAPSIEVRKDDGEGVYEESVSARLLSSDGNNSMTAEDGREEKRDIVPPLNNTFLPLPAPNTNTATSPVTQHAPTVPHVSLSLSAPEASHSSAAHLDSSPPHPAPMPLVITTADSESPSAAVGAVVSPSASAVTDQQTATTPIHLPLTPLSPPSHHRSTSSTSSASSSNALANLLPSTTSSASIHLGFATPLTSLPSSSRPSVTSGQASSHTTHRQSASSGQLSLPRDKDRDEASALAGDAGAAGGLVVPGTAAGGASASGTALNVDRRERRSTLKEKRELKPIVAPEHARTSSTPSIIPAAAE